MLVALWYRYNGATGSLLQSKFRRPTLAMMTRNCPKYERKLSRRWQLYLGLPRHPSYPSSGRLSCWANSASQYASIPLVRGRDTWMLQTRSPIRTDGAFVLTPPGGGASSGPSASYLPYSISPYLDTITISVSIQYQLAPPT
jgi:hypothetical protein